MSIHKKLGLNLLLGIVFITSVGSRAMTENTLIDTDHGTIQGSSNGVVVSFLGIPYAKPPVGELRWRAPQPLPRWQGVKETMHFAPDCIQKPFDGDAAPLSTRLSEDCLYLNIWAPANQPQEKLPVIVWIYGGGYVNGGSSSAIYRGDRFAESGVILVSINYRIGRFGFFAYPALTTEAGDKEPLGNYGYMDQIAALNWIKNNIRRFGGDENNITLMGESAGGASVLDLMVSPAAQGLFDKAIVMSGGGRGSLLTMRDLTHVYNSLASAETVGVAFAKSMGIENTGNDGLAKLRALPASKIVDGLNMGTMLESQTYAGGPIRDGKIVTGPASQLFTKGKQAKIPLIIGATNSDLGFPTTDHKESLFASFGRDKDRAKAVFDSEGTLTGKALAEIVARERLMIEPARNIARLASATETPVYAYRFSYVADCMRKEWLGAPHASELPYLFRTLPARYGDAVTPRDTVTAEALHAYFVNFAKYGKPTANGYPEWPRYSSATDKIVNFDIDALEIIADPLKQQLDLIAESSTIEE